jgi:hypothetical protein
LTFPEIRGSDSRRLRHRWNAQGAQKRGTLGKNTQALTRDTSYFFPPFCDFCAFLWRTAAIDGRLHEPITSSYHQKPATDREEVSE